MHECSIEREVMKNAGIKRIDTYRDLLNELNITIINNRETIKKQRAMIEELRAKVTKPGKWKPFDVPWYQCSECGAVRKQASFMENFCPNCGANMRGESE